MDYMDLKTLAKGISIWSQKKQDSSVLYFPPKQSILKKILETCFEVSCKTEEDRSLSFRICCMDLNKPEVIGKTTGAMIFKFEKRVLFNSQELKKIALSSNPSRALLCIAPEYKYQNRLYFSGIVSCYSNSEDLSNGLAYWGYGFPQVVNLLVEKPGKLSICIGERVLLSYDCGTISRGRYDLFSIEPFKTIVKKGQLLLDNCYGDERVKTETPVFENFLKAIISCIRHNTHGGSLLIVPNLNSVSNSLKIKYILSENRFISNKLKTIMKELTSIGEREPQPICRNENNKGRLELILSITKTLILAISDFASVDGALVIDYSGGVIGYGAEIVIKDDPSFDSVIFIDENDKEEEVKIDNYGTRHRSVFRFCNEHADSLGFIFSQDGGITACAKEHERVKVYTNIKNELDNQHAQVLFESI